ncbi:hypothetical protein GALMADRAFT_138826 [Galerina marginata CBS 339.88]|uniref:T6SS Phospholipase effector Tle1-like catalytic domain-containing protein n=1 Tax=Galerina marginata (strain CBS 339.88) TaxID=685588 RepID=A0A067T5Y3_GALM3|nr:hypothetical protein GALMADRAFT_138826 [Galerina marginata CBS 339.88]
MNLSRSSSEGTSISEDVPTKSTTHIETIPPAFPGRARTLVLCFDGTGDQVGIDNTNVVEIKDMLVVSEEEQLVYYQKGIGTYTPKIPGVRERVKIPGISYISQKWDQAVAWSLDARVIEAYLWLVDNYRHGDKICMFGFSRGSYTARAVAGMLFKVGLLPKAHREKAQAAFESYKDAKTATSWKASKAFQRTWGSIDVPIMFLGCWDTVNSVGYLTTKSLPFTAINPMVRNFRHAISMDERRVKFRTNLWSPYMKTSPRIGSRSPHMNPREKMIQSFSEAKSKRMPPTDVSEVWFSGCHCDVGVPNEIRPNLAHISLRWMIRQCFQRNTGIMFRKDKLMVFHLDPDALHPVVKPRPPAIESQSKQIQPPIGLGPISRVKGWLSYFNPFGSRKYEPEPTPIAANEEDADALDALAPVYDMLDIKPLLWLPFEKMPIETYNPVLNKRAKEVFDKRPRIMRAPRFFDIATKKVADGRLKVHRTVMTRMKAQHIDGSPYVPKALLPDMKPISLSNVRFNGDHPHFDWVD